MKYEAAILGSRGFLGENLMSGLRENYSVLGVSRVDGNPYALSATSNDKEIHSVFEQLEPEALIINTIGRLAHSIDESNPQDVSAALMVNGEFPQRLFKIASSKGLRFIHISTDAVFSNKAGNVDETSATSPQGVYGTSKLLGEVVGPNALTIRCSFVGVSIDMKKSGLWSWIFNLNQGETIDGFQNQLWSGVTTNQLVGLCSLLVDKKIFNQVSAVSSIHHFCPNPVITKYELVNLIAKQIRRDITVVPINSEITITRNLVSKFKSLNNLMSHEQYDWPTLISATHMSF